MLPLSKRFWSLIYFFTDDRPVHVKKNRRALWDIGNIASIPKVPGGKIDRPLTRNFRAKFLENAHKKVQFFHFSQILFWEYWIWLLCLVLSSFTKQQTNLDKASVLDGALPKKPEAVKDNKKVTYSSVLNARSKVEDSLWSI